MVAGSYALEGRLSRVERQFANWSRVGARPVRVSSAVYGDMCALLLLARDKHGERVERSYAAYGFRPV